MTSKPPLVGGRYVQTVPVAFISYQEKSPALLRGTFVGAETYLDGYSAGIGTGTRLSIGTKSLSAGPV